ncbi:YidH family protein [Dickeya dadantii]|uniref:YidH family protein n=1 Tax=Dickeya dadantii TaxID=204038 RepID=UPI001C0AB08D|nr:DUF202 domain-containing protein [Dickeya dadantii]QWT42934.1 DUF202 domain-containing protein [Dickeya dadantii]
MLMSDPASSPTPPTSPDKKIPWQQQGSMPDYRFSLANERTFLAWIRTALAFLAGAVAIDQFAPTLAPPAVRGGIAVFLSLAAALLAWMAYRRWADNERAMRTGQALPYTRLLIIIASCVSAISVALALVILLL